MASPITLTVSQLNEYVGAIIDSTELLSDIYIKGEISNFTNHYKTGHFYFTLKDSGGNLKAVMFRSNACKVAFIPENGMKVTAHGRISVYERDGIYQLYCDELIPDGIGSLYLAFEQLKAKLSAEGLFDESHKKTIPRYPSKIGIVTSPTGAAIADILNILQRRFPMCEIQLYGALVQGTGAPESLIKGLLHFDGNVDTIIIGRGGGSIEDLWAFNDERLAREIYRCKTPVISAVGHEIDFTICDFVADLRAPTPSAAAELAVPDTDELKRQLEAFRKRMEYSLDRRLSLSREKISAISEKSFFKNPQNYVDKKRTELLNSEIGFYSAFEKLLERKRNNLSNISAKMQALSPLSVLSRGYSVVYSSKEELLSSVKSLKTGDDIIIEMSDGKASATINEIYKKRKP